MSYGLPKEILEAIVSAVDEQQRLSHKKKRELSEKIIKYCLNTTWRGPDYVQNYYVIEKRNGRWWVPYAVTPSKTEAEAASWKDYQEGKKLFYRITLLPRLPS